MTYTQLITVKGAAEQDLHDLMVSWDQEQAGVAPGYQGTRVLSDKESDQATIEVDFASEEEAQRNNERQETRDWAEQLRKLADGEPTYLNTEQVYSTYDGT